MARIQFDDGLVQGYWEDLPDGRRHINFYGSWQKEDWIDDLTAIKLPFIHQGFKKQAENAENLIWGINGVNKERWPKLWLTGHSLGAAIAVICTYKFKNEVSECTVAGCPRVGGLIWWLMARNLPITRYAMEGDIVSELPPWWLIWKHVGKVVNLEWKGEPFPKKPKTIEELAKAIQDRHMPNAYQPYVNWSI